MAITSDDIEQAFQSREAAYDALAEAEDEVGHIALELEDYKEGSTKAKEVQERLKAMQPELTALKRAYTKAQWQIERLHLLVQNK